MADKPEAGGATLPAAGGATAEQRAKQLAQQLAERDEQLRALAQTAPHHTGQLGPYDPDRAPDDCLYIEQATEVIATRLAYAEGSAVNALLAVLHAGDVRAWERGFGKKSVVHAKWADAHIDLDDYRSNHPRRDGIRFEGRGYHLHHFLISKDDLVGWLHRQEVQPAAPSPVARSVAPPPNPWLDAAEAMTWIAFRKAVPVLEWTEKLPGYAGTQAWGFNPPDVLLTALQSRAEGRAWKPERSPPWPARQYRAAVRSLMRDTGKTSGELASELTADVERWAAIVRAIIAARKRLVDAVRDGRVTVWARPARANLESEPGASHIALEPTLFLGPRTIDWDGWINEDAERPSGDWIGFHHRGTYYDEARFRSSDIQRQWPLAPVEAEPAFPPTAATTTPHHVPRQRGRKPAARARVVAEMKAAAERAGDGGKSIRDEREKSLASTYQCSRDTARKARDEAFPPSVEN